MNTRDWYDYLGFLRGQVSNVDLQEPESIGEAYNNFQVMQDIENVVETKLPKPKAREKVTS